MEKRTLRNYFASNSSSTPPTDESSTQLKKPRIEFNLDEIIADPWKHSDAILCCSLKPTPMFTFANKAGLDILETTLINLQDISLETILDDEGRKALYSEFPKIMQQGFAYLPSGVCKSSMERQASYEQVVAWKVLSDDDTLDCLAFMLVHRTFM